MPTETPVLWPTPTPYPTTDATPIIAIPTSITYDIAEEVVAGYNRYDIGNYFEFVLLFLLIIGGLISIMRRVQKA